jgi:phosphohistidine swiveling domain-containing protein
VATTAREFGIPAMVGLFGATTTIRDGQTIEVDGTIWTVPIVPMAVSH